MGVGEGKQKEEEGRKTKVGGWGEGDEGNTKGEDVERGGRQQKGRGWGIRKVNIGRGGREEGKQRVKANEGRVMFIQDRQYGCTLHSQGRVSNATCGPLPLSIDSTHDPNRTGRSEVMVCVSLSREDRVREGRNSKGKFENISFTFSLHLRF